jgi:hypothetical protein
MKWLRFLFGFFRKSKKPETPPKKTGLYYDNLPGACGHIFCTECSNIVLIDVWIHDYRKKVINTSYQCLDCGKFTNIPLSKEDEIPNCSCGGTLSNTHKLFCPVCKGDKLQ